MCIRDRFQICPVERRTNHGALFSREPAEILALLSDDRCSSNQLAFEILKCVDIEHRIDAGRSFCTELRDAIHRVGRLARLDVAPSFLHSRADTSGTGHHLGAIPWRLHSYARIAPAIPAFRLSIPPGMGIVTSWSAPFTTDVGRPLASEPTMIATGLRSPSPAGSEPVRGTAATAVNPRERREISVA